MPERKKSTLHPPQSPSGPPVSPHLDPETPADDPPAAIPPIIDPDKFEQYPFIRETFLVYVSDPEANAILRGFGELLYNLTLEFWGHWPDQPEGLLRASLRAAVADLRHVQGFLLEQTSPGTAHSSPHEAHLAKLGGEISVEVGKLADRLEGELGTWRGGEAEP
jgi:hypothetical protein